jgi:putative transposase
MKTNNSYHSDLKIAIALQFEDILPTEIIALIPKSTFYRFKNSDFSKLIGCELSKLAEDVDIIKQFARSKAAIKIFKACIRIKSVIVNLSLNINSKITDFNIKKKIIACIIRVKDSIGLERTLKYFNISSSLFYSWLSEITSLCNKSLTKKCPRIFPTQITEHETKKMKSMLTSPDFKYWPIASIAYHALDNNILSASLSSWYKYAHLFDISRPKPSHRRKDRVVGIRVPFPNGLWHADITRFVTIDMIPSYIYTLIDNFSRFILSWAVSLSVSMHIRLDTIKQAFDKYIKPNKDMPRSDQTSLLYTKSKIIDLNVTTVLLVDGGCENNNHIVENYLFDPLVPVEKVIARQDVYFSNSIIEAHNKVLKYSYLYKDQIYNNMQLHKRVDFAIDDYNNRPHYSLNGLTPYQAFTGVNINKEKRKQQTQYAKEQRLLINQGLICPDCSAND